MLVAEAGPFKRRKGGFIFCHECKHDIRLIALGERVYVTCTEWCADHDCHTPNEIFSCYSQPEFMEALKDLLILVQDNECHVCEYPLLNGQNKRQNVTFDHMIPRCEGGPSHVDNFKLAHRGCNTRRMYYDRVGDKWVKKKES